MCGAAMGDNHAHQAAPARPSPSLEHQKEIDVTNSTEHTNESLLIDEFEIIELEDRLELAGRCNGRCDGQSKPTSA